MNVSEYLIYLQSEQLLICRTCRYCLQPKGVEQHLYREHKTIPLNTRNELVRYSQTLSVKNPTNVATPVNVVPAYEHLNITEGYCCLLCNALYGTLDSMRTHVGKYHIQSFREGNFLLNLLIF